MVHFKPIKWHLKAFANMCEMYFLLGGMSIYVRVCISKSSRRQWVSIWAVGISSSTSSSYWMVVRRTEDSQAISLHVHIIYSVVVSANVISPASFTHKHTHTLCVACMHLWCWSSCNRRQRTYHICPFDDGSFPFGVCGCVSVVCALTFYYACHLCCILYICDACKHTHTHTQEENYHQPRRLRSKERCGECDDADMAHWGVNEHALCFAAFLYATYACACAWVVCVEQRKGRRQRTHDTHTPHKHIREERIYDAYIIKSHGWCWCSQRSTVIVRIINAVAINKQGTNKKHK